MIPPRYAYDGNTKLKSHFSIHYTLIVIFIVIISQEGRHVPDKCNVVHLIRTNPSGLTSGRCRCREPDICIRSVRCKASDILILLVPIELILQFYECLLNYHILNRKDS